MNTNYQNQETETEELGLFCGRVMTEKADSGYPLQNGIRFREVEVYLKHIRLSEFKINNLVMFLDFRSEGIVHVEWHNVRVKQNGEVYQVVGPYNGVMTVLAEGTYSACIMYVGAARKTYARKHEAHLRERVSSQISRYEELLLSAGSSLLPFVINHWRHAAVEMASWVGGNYHKRIMTEAEEIRRTAKETKRTISGSIHTVKVAGMVLIDQPHNAAAEKPAEIAA